MKIKSDVVKRSISLSILVSEWADNLADQKGFGSNFSAYIADLIRRDKEREDALKLAFSDKDIKFSSSKVDRAAAQIVEAVSLAAQKQKPFPPKK
jgi:hypothetical protein